MTTSLTTNKPTLITESLYAKNDSIAYSKAYIRFKTEEIIYKVFDSIHKSRNTPSIITKPEFKILDSEGNNLKTKLPLETTNAIEQFTDNVMSGNSTLGLPPQTTD